MAAAPLLLRLAALVALTTLCAATAYAQSDAARETEAQALFASGRRAADAGLWSEAVDRFSRSYDAYPTASALYNLAVALRSLGRHMDARDALARLLSEHQGELSEEQELDAQALLTAESVRTARITVEGLPRSTRFDVAIDGAARDDTRARPLVLELDPGERRLRLANETYEPFVWEGTLLEGQQLRLEPELVLRDVPGNVALDEDESSVLASPWFWTITGVIVIGAAAALLLLLGQPDRVEPLSDRRYTL